MSQDELYAQSPSSRCQLYSPSFLFFTLAIVLLATLNWSYTSVEMKRPSILLAGCVFSLLNSGRSHGFSIVSRMILLYIIAMCFNQLSGRVVHVGSITVHLSLLALIPLAISFGWSRLQASPPASAVDGDLYKSWAAVFGLIIGHMLLLGGMLGRVYGYGYEQDFAVTAHMCMYFLVFVFAWGPMNNRFLARIVAVVFGIFLAVTVARGF